MENKDQEYMGSFKLLNNADVSETEMNLSSSTSKYVSAYCRRKTIVIDRKPTYKLDFQEMIPPPAMFIPQPERRRFSVNEDFQEGHDLWYEGYDAYLRARAGEVVEEVLGGVSTEDFIDALIGNRRGYIPKRILSNA